MPSTSTKVDTSNFKFIKIENQYMLGVSARTESSGTYISFFDRESDLVSYVDVSYSGFDLPAVEMIFSFSDAKLLPYLNEKSVFVLSIGKDLNSQIQSTFNIVEANIKQKVEGKWVARVVGLYNTVDYMKRPKRKMHAGCSSEIAKKILSETLGTQVKDELGVKSKDKMFWFQSKESDYSFLHELWLHSYLPDSIWMTAIDFEGNAKITDLRKQAKSQPKIMLTTGQTTTDNSYTILDDFEVKDDSAIYNSFGGYDTSRQVYNIDDARRTTLKKKESVLLSESDIFNKATNVESEAPYSIQNSNVHVNYHSAPMNNKNMFLSLKALQLDVTAEGEFVPLQLLDYVMVKDIQSNGQAQEDYSGIYMVGKIAHQIANKKIYTHLSLWREAQNRVALPSKSERAGLVSSKVTSVQDKLDAVDGLMSFDAYSVALNKCNELQDQINSYKEKIQDSLEDTEAYKAYKALDKKYRQLKSYINEVYYASSILANVFPEMDVIQEQLDKITLETPIDEVRAVLRKYTSIESHIYDLESKVVDKISSVGVYSNYLDARNKYNSIKNKIEALRSIGVIIEDINANT